MAESLILVQGKLHLQDFSLSVEHLPPTVFFPRLQPELPEMLRYHSTGEDGEVACVPWSSWAYAATSVDRGASYVCPLTLLPGPQALLRPCCFLLACPPHPTTGPLEVCGQSGPLLSCSRPLRKTFSCTQASWSPPFPHPRK